MQAPAGDLPPLLSGQIGTNCVLKRPANPRRAGDSVQHGMLLEKGLAGLGMSRRIKKQATEVLLLITPILAIGRPVSLAFKTQRGVCIYGCCFCAVYSLGKVRCGVLSSASNRGKVGSLRQARS